MIDQYEQQQKNDQNGFFEMLRNALQAKDVFALVSLCKQCDNLGYPKAFTKSFLALYRDDPKTKLEASDFCCSSLLVSPKSHKINLSRGHSQEAANTKTEGQASIDPSTKNKHAHNESQGGWIERAIELGLLDIDYYIATNPDIDPCEIDAWRHFYERCIYEDHRDPSQYFSSKHYYDLNPDVRAAGMNALAHYVIHGRNRRTAKSTKVQERLDAYRDTLDIRSLAGRLERKPSISGIKVAVYLHFHYVDTLEELTNIIKELPESIRLIFSTTSEEKRSEILGYAEKKKFLPRVDACEVYAANRGRDLGAFAYIYKHLLKYDIVCKLHVKKSPHLGHFGRNWSSYLVSSTIGDSAVVAAAIDYLHSNQAVGILAPAPFWGTNNEDWGENFAIAENLAKKISNGNILIEADKLRYPSATVFWFKPAALNADGLTSISADTFPAEPIPIDGTSAHALERLMPYIAKAEGYETIYYHDPILALSVTNEWKLYTQIEACASDKITIIVGHEASNTGAPRTALALQRTLVEEEKCDCIMLLLKGGPLTLDYEKIGPVVKFNDNLCLNNLSSVFKLTSKRCRVITNTVVTAEIGKYAKEYGHEHISLVHENAQTGYWSKDMFRNALCADLSVFPGIGVMNAALEFCKLPVPASTIVCPQGIYRNDFPAFSQHQSHTSVRNELGIPHEAKIVLGCGTIEPRKGTDLFFETAEHINQNYSSSIQIAFVWVGQIDPNEGSIRQWGQSLVEQIISLKRQNFYILGDCMKADRYFQAADVFYLASRKDPFPGVVLEAMACKKPIVAFKGATDVGNAFTPNVGGSLVFDFNIKTAASHIFKYVSRPIESQKAGIHNHTIVSQNYTFKEYWKKLLANLEHKISERNSIMTSEQTFSIITPLHKTPLLFLQQLIDAIKRQTYHNWEICLAGDSLSAEVIDYIEHQASQDKRIKFKYLDKASGISHNTNEALSSSTGKYLIFIDHDDLIPAHCLESLLACHNMHNCDFVYTAEDKTDSTGRSFFAPVYKTEFSEESLISSNYITHLCSFARELVERVGFFRPEYDGAQDYDYILRASALASKIVYLPLVLYHWRIFEGSTSDGTSSSKPYAVEAGRRAIESYLRQRSSNDFVVTNGSRPFTYEVSYMD